MHIAREGALGQNQYPDILVPAQMANLHEILALGPKLNLPATLFYKKKYFDQPFPR